MTSAPKVRYTTSGDVSIAYQVTGEGDRDLVVVWGYAQHLELQWESREVATVKDLVVGSRLAFEDRGTHALKGVPDTWHLYAARP